VTSAVENDAVVVRTYIYEPVTNTWKTRAAPPGGGTITRVTLDGKACVLAVRGTGEETSDPVPTLLYTP
jgi:hypothetical protein